MMLTILFLVGHSLILYDSVSVLCNAHVYLYGIGIRSVTAHLEFPFYEGAL
jgi:hypothetical protein